ncbi:MAG: 3-oxoadipate enol-lactonase [Myxococcales bacterium]
MDVTLRDGVRLHVIDQRPSGAAADGEAPAVLWLQGLNAPAAAWAVQLAHFGRRVRSIAPDSRGVGKSDAPAGPYTTAGLADDALAVLDAHGVGRAHLVGLSLGGAVAQELALRAPARVKSLALLGSFATQAPRSAALLRAWRALYPLAAQSPALREAWELQSYAWLFTDRFWRGESNVRAALRFAATQPLQAPAGFLGQIDAALAHDARARLPALRVPALVIHGALDQLSPLAAGEELAALIPGAELLVVGDAGHAVNLEGQRAVNDALRALWARAA